MTRPIARTFALTLLLAALPVKGGPDPSEAAFRAVRDEVSALRKDESKRKLRHHYERLIKKLRAVAEEHPEGAYADDALYVAAQLLDEQHAVSRIPEDLTAAVDAYRLVASRYPTSNLADDALYSAATLLVERKRDPAAARPLLEQLIAMEAPADFRPKARQLLATLPAAPASERSTTKGASAEKAPAKSEKDGKKDPVTAALERMAEQMKREAVIPQVEVLPDPPPAGTPSRQVKLLSHERSEEESLVRMRFSGPVGVKRGEVPAEKGRARRIFFDFTPAKLPRSLGNSVEVNDGVMARVRAGQFDRETVRLVVELEDGAADEPLLQLQSAPFEMRLSVTLPVEHKEPPVVAKAEPKEPELPVDQLPSPSEVKQRLGTSGAPGGVPLAAQFGLSVKRIVLDPGHGGKDTGAIGKKGTREKDIALDIARQTRALLQKKLPGVEVIMTRDEDVFVPLEERTRIANDASADLFISIHCNANPSRKVRGVETYYLNITHDRYAIRLAARENVHAGEDKRISDLQFILADLAMKSNVDESIRLGRQVQKSLVGRLRQDYTGVQDHGLKHALFYVLMGARMPAILVEASFLSNSVEETRLRDEKYRETVAEGIVAGVQRFVEERQALYAGP